MVWHDEPTKEEFEKMPLVVEGESKEVRYFGDGLVAIRLKPTIYSYTHNRAGEIEDSDKSRLQAIKNLLPVIIASGLEHTYQKIGKQFILSELVMQPSVKGEQEAFWPKDLPTDRVNKLPKASPIEVVVKKRHTGTSKHRYFNFSNYITRSGEYIDPEALYPEPVVRFDWRNPMHNPITGKRLADEVLPLQTADLFIDTEKAAETALRAFEVLDNFMKGRGLELWDICFFVSEDGKKLFGEISQDCMRVRAIEGSSLDKDVWRSGGSSEKVLQKWQEFNELVNTA